MGDIRSPWVDVTAAAGPILLRLGCATKMAVFEISLGHRNSRIYPNPTIFFAEVFQITSKFVLMKKKLGVRCTLNLMMY